MNLENKRVAFQYSPGFSGSSLLQSLVDSHPKILTLPTEFPYLIFQEKNIKSGEQLVSELLQDKRFNIFLKQKKTSENGDFSNFEFNQDLFFKKIIEKFNLQNQINRRKFVLIVHEAFAEARSIPENEIELIYIHLHNPFYYQCAHQDFPKAKWLGIVRNPLSILHSSLHRAVVKNEEKNLPVFRNYESWINHITRVDDRLEYFMTYQKLNYWKSYTVHLEDLHEKPEVKTREIAEFLDINFHQTLLTPTLGGIPYISNSRLNKNLKGFSEKQTKFNFVLKHFNESEIRFYFHFFRKFIDFNSYRNPYPLRWREVIFYKTNFFKSKTLINLLVIDIRKRQLKLATTRNFVKNYLKFIVLKLKAAFYLREGN